MPNRQLLLVKHSLPHFAENAPPDEWHLAAEGRARCARLAERLAEYRVSAMACSPEPKAIETAEVVSERLGLPVQVVAELHEQRRRRAKYTNQSEFEEQIRQLFAFPDRLVYGEETADQAHARFAHAVESLVMAHVEGTFAVFAHGTVISLFVSRACAVDPFTLWKRLGMPSFVVTSLPEYKLSTIVDQV